jgi:hypothetical protein
MRIELRSREVDKIHKRRHHYDIPEWQRGEVWSLEKKQLLIDSMLRGWHIPKFYFLKTSDSPESWEVIDGQQRLATIFEFLENELSLSEETGSEFGGAYYSDLRPEISDRFDDFKLDYEEVIEADPGEAQEYYIRLQQGLQLTAAEQLNAVPGNLTSFIRRLSKHDFLAKKVAVRDYRLAHFDICCKIVAIDVEGFGMRLRLPELRHFLQSNASFSNRSNVAKRVQRTLDYLNEEIFLEWCPILRNRSLVQSFATLTASMLRCGSATRMGARLKEFFEAFAHDLVREVEKGHSATDKDLLQFQATISANVLTGPHTRHKILLRKLLLFDTTLAEFLGPESVIESDMVASLADMSKAIQDSVYALNTEYSGRRGEDLFKPTNETNQALSALPQPVTTMGEYGTFIDNLYFLFYEGTANGQRFGSTIPEAVTDIRDLRTQIRHDVDHGKPARIRAKHKSVANVLRKYSNVSSPQMVSPESFLLIQARILSALRDMLLKLRSDLSG